MEDSKVFHPLLFQGHGAAKEDNYLPRAKSGSAFGNKTVVLLQGHDTVKVVEVVLEGFRRFIQGYQPAVGCVKPIVDLAALRFQRLYNVFQKSLLVRYFDRVFEY